MIFNDEKMNIFIIVSSQVLTAPQEGTFWNCSEMNLSEEDIFTVYILGLDKKFFFCLYIYMFYWNYVETPTFWMFLENHMCIVLFQFSEYKWWLNNFYCSEALLLDIYLKINF